MFTRVGRKAVDQARRRTALVVGTIVLATMLPHGAAGVFVTCGMTVDHDIKLTSDLGPCPSHGLVAGTDGITIDLGGFRIFGTDTAGDGDGVRLVNRTGVKVRNGTVSRFDEGVHIFGGGQNAVSKIVALRNVGDPFDSKGDGILIQDSGNNVIKNSKAQSNGPFAGISILGTSSGNSIIKNVVRDNDVPFNATDNIDIGIRLDNGSSHSTVRGNEVSYNGLDGITTFDSTTAPATQNNVIVGNLVKGNGFHTMPHRLGDGIAILAAGPSGFENDVVQGNAVKGNAGNGVGLYPDTQGNLVTANKATSNASADIRDLNGNCVQNTYLDNDGVVFDPACTRG